MATKEISQLPSTNTSNDTDLLMTRQGAQDRAVQVQYVRDIGTEAGQSLGVGGYGIGGNAIDITSLYGSNNADLIDRNGVYKVNGASNVPVSVGELKHWQTSNNEATQEVIGQNQEAYFRKKVAGTWLAWVLYGAANKATVRTDLNVPSNSEALLLANRLQEIEDAGAAARREALENVGFNRKTSVWTGSSTSVSFVNDIPGGDPGDGYYLVHWGSGTDLAFIHRVSGFNTSVNTQASAVLDRSINVIIFGAAANLNVREEDWGSGTSSNLPISEIWKVGG